MNSDIFESDDVANSYPVFYRTINQYEHICSHYRALYGACSEHILLQRKPGSPGYMSESEYYRMCVDRPIRFEYATCGRGIFESEKKKSRIKKYPDTSVRGLNVTPTFSEILFEWMAPFVFLIFPVLARLMLAGCNRTAESRRCGRPRMTNLDDGTGSPHIRLEYE